MNHFAEACNALVLLSSGRNLADMRGANGVALPDPMPCSPRAAPLQSGLNCSEFPNDSISGGRRKRVSPRLDRSGGRLRNKGDLRSMLACRRPGRDLPTGEWISDRPSSSRECALYGQSRRRGNADTLGPQQVSIGLEVERLRNQASESPAPASAGLGAWMQRGEESPPVETAQCSDPCGNGGTAGVAPGPRLSTERVEASAVP